VMTIEFFDSYLILPCCRNPTNLSGLKDLTGLFID
jgi:hypothetical protein